MGDSDDEDDGDTMDMGGAIGHVRDVVRDGTCSDAR